MKCSHFFCWIIIHVLAIIYATISEIWGHFQPVWRGPKDKTMLRHKIDCDKCPERILLFCQVFVFLSFFLFDVSFFFFIYYVLHKKRIICHFYNSESSTTDNQTKREVEETIKKLWFWTLLSLNMLYKLKN